MKKISAFIYRIIRYFVWLFYPHIRVEGIDNLPDEPCIIVGNHAKMNAPIGCELYFPGKHYTWTAGQMMHIKEVPAYAFRDFWAEKPRYIRWFFKLLSYIIAPVSACVFNNADCIGVYHDMRIISTFRESVRRMADGASIIIFPEHNVPYNGIVWEFQDRFVDVAKMYYKKTKKEVCFVPLYTAPSLKSMYIGEPVRFDHEAPIEAERKRIAHAMMDGVSRIAKSLPQHVVVPYPNIPKSEYPLNREDCEDDGGSAKLLDNINARAEEIDEAVRHMTRSSKHFASGAPVVDYRNFRFSRLNDPEFRHLKLLGGWIIYFVLYFLTENFIPESRLHVIHCALDDMIPFNEYFLIFYCFWYVLIVISLLYFMLYDIDSFKKLQIFIMVTQAIAMLIYIIYPSVQDLRPAVMPRDNFFCRLAEFIYWFDTPTGVFPSLHVAYSIGIASVWVKNKKTPFLWKLFVVFACIMISISVMFVKQHSALDVALALPLGMVAEHVVFGRFHAARRRLMRWRVKKHALRYRN